MSGRDPVIVVRAPNWLGDTVMALPALGALRKGMGDARIIVVGRWAPLLLGQQVGDAMLAYPAGFHDRRGLARALHEDRPEIAVLLPSSLESAWAALAWGARRRVGFDTDARGPLLTDRVPLPCPRLHQVDEYRALVSHLGVEAPAERPTWRLGADPAAEREVSALLGDSARSFLPRLAGLHLGAAFGPSKLWPPPRFAQLADRLADAGLTPVLLGGPGDAALARDVAAAARARLSSTVGRDRPALLPRLLARLRCLVSGDTGVAHLAAALGVPTVTLFGPTDPALTRPRSSAGRVVEHRVPCAPCFLPACPIEHLCLRGISVEEVERAVLRAALL